MASKSELFKSKNRELSERKKPPLHYVDFKDLLVFTEEDLQTELEKLPFQKLKRDDDNMLNRRRSTGNLHAMASQESLYSIVGDLGGAAGDTCYKGSLERRKRSSSASILSISRPSSSRSYRSFFDVSRAFKGDNYEEEEFPYDSPIPPSLRHLNLKDFLSTDIDWKMLTMVRPPTKKDEQFFSRTVELTQLHHKTKVEDGYGLKKAVLTVSRHPHVLRYSKMRALSDDFDRLDIEGDFDYESYARCTPDVDEKSREQENIVQEQVAKLMDEDFGENFPTDDQDEKKKPLLKVRGRGRSKSPAPGSSPGKEGKANEKPDMTTTRFAKNSDLKSVSEDKTPEGAASVKVEGHLPPNVITSNLLVPEASQSVDKENPEDVESGHETHVSGDVEMKEGSNGDGKKRRRKKQPRNESRSKRDKSCRDKEALSEDMSNTAKIRRGRGHDPNAPTIVITSTMNVN